MPIIHYILYRCMLWTHICTERFGRTLKYWLKQPSLQQSEGGFTNHCLGLGMDIHSRGCLRRVYNNIKKWIFIQIKSKKIDIMFLPGNHPPSIPVPSISHPTACLKMVYAQQYESPKEMVQSWCIQMNVWLVYHWFWLLGIYCVFVATWAKLAKQCPHVMGQNDRWKIF